MFWILNLLLAFLVSLVRFNAGRTCIAKKGRKRPEKPLQLYEYEACPFCRRVREALSYLDLDVLVYPCPRETLKKYGTCKDSRYRPVVKELGGRLIFPFLVDENTGERMYESEDIVRYLFREYGGGAEPPFHLFGKLFVATSVAGSALRPKPHMGMLRTPSKEPPMPTNSKDTSDHHLKSHFFIELYGCESSASSRLVREALCTLELPYLLHNMPKGGDPAKLSALWENSGSAKIPFLVDRATDFSSNSAKTIIQYLFKEYQTGETVKESFLDYTTEGASVDHGTLPFGAGRNNTKKKL